jgi:hypothetical protein
MKAIILIKIVLFFSALSFSLPIFADNKCDVVNPCAVCGKTKQFVTWIYKDHEYFGINRNQGTCHIWPSNDAIYGCIDASENSCHPSSVTFQINCGQESEKKCATNLDKELKKIGCSSNNISCAKDGRNQNYDSGPGFKNRIVCYGASDNCFKPIFDGDNLNCPDPMEKKNLGYPFQIEFCHWPNQSQNAVTTVPPKSESAK